MQHLPTIQNVAASLRRGDLKIFELVESCLDRIDELDGQLQAWEQVDSEGARREAARQQDLLDSGTDLGPLQGIPLGIKDIIDVAGWPTEAGSPMLKGCMADGDSAVVANLRKQGAILLGKTVTTEFAFIDPAATRNPWNTEHTPGGSSSGSAAAVASGMCMAALGSQTGGSIIRPASYCGIAGLKATFGNVSTRGVVPVSRNLDHVGPLAQCVADLRILLAAMTGTPVSSQPLTKPPALFLIGDYFLEQADDTVREITLAACEALQTAGAKLVSCGLPESFRSVHVMHRCIMAVEAAETHFNAYTESKDAYGKEIGALVEEGLTTFAIDYSLALRHQQLFQQNIAEILGTEAVAITPSTMTPAPAGLDSTGDPAFNSPWTYAGVPTVTIPCGLSPDGLPCGLQLIGPRGREDLLLDVAQWCERVLNFQHFVNRADA